MLRLLHFNCFSVIKYVDIILHHFHGARQVISDLCACAGIDSISHGKNAFYLPIVEIRRLLSNDCFDFSLQKAMHYAKLYLSHGSRTVVNFQGNKIQSDRRGNYG